MPNQHQRTPSIITHTRLTEPLPSLPLPFNERHPQLSIATQLPYRDDPAQDNISLADLQTQLRSPPGYEPMFDYLRSHQGLNIRPPIYIPSIHPTLLAGNESEEPYRDEPFVVHIVEEAEDIAQPPPSYHELYRQHEIDMMRLQREFDTDGTPAEQVEELVKWVVAMLMLCLTIAGVGTALNWGRPR
jgi:hypothetical protein